MNKGKIGVVNYYLARIVMNYHKEARDVFDDIDDIDDILYDSPTEDYYVDSDGEIVMEVERWKPLDNAYQARTVLRRMVKDGKV